MRDDDSCFYLLNVPYISFLLKYIKISLHKINSANYMSTL